MYFPFSWAKDGGWLESWYNGKKCWNPGINFTLKIWSFYSHQLDNISKSNGEICPRLGLPTFIQITVFITFHILTREKLKVREVLAPQWLHSYLPSLKMRMSKQFVFPHSESYSKKTSIFNGIKIRSNQQRQGNSLWRKWNSTLNHKPKKT